MSRLLIYLSVLMPSLASAQINPFDTLNHTRVMAYEFNGEGGRLIEYCVKNEKSRVSDSVDLKMKLLDEFESIIIDSSSYGNTTAACFDPHLALIYYSGPNIVASVNVCLECNYLVSSILIPAISLRKNTVNEDYSYLAYGFSSSARRKINAFSKKLGFTSYLSELNSVFD